MAHIRLSSAAPGMTGLLQSRPETAKPLRELAQLLLRNSTALTPAEGETIATYVSVLNRCEYCSRSHGAVARILLGYDGDLVGDLRSGIYLGGLNARMAALMRLAALVQAIPVGVAPADIEEAKEAGAGEGDIHDTVLIAAAFCMYNRYVDGLGTAVPENADAYEAIGRRLVDQGYV
jgi:uncharacterized peroxidase-related enzyme